MKVRTNFVSNSSTSSFVFLGQKVTIAGEQFESLFNFIQENCLKVAVCKNNPNELCQTSLFEDLEDEPEEFEHLKKQSNNTFIVGKVLSVQDTEYPKPKTETLDTSKLLNEIRLVVEHLGQKFDSTQLTLVDSIIGS